MSINLNESGVIEWIESSQSKLDRSEQGAP
jgi:hypothetical protein